jgi:DNA-binding response OmpR family regulator
MRILVVDDEHLVARTLTLILERSGFEVSTFSTVDEALASAWQSPPDLLLCDIDMPQRDGLDLMREFGRTLPDCPILVLTGFYRSLASISGAAALLQQPVRILTKPCPPAEVLREARYLLKIA